MPYIVRKCTEVIERYAINAAGIYRKNGNPADVQRLRGMFNADVDGDVHISDNMVAGENIHVISSALKLFFRELPDPLLTRQLYEGFQQAACEFLIFEFDLGNSENTNQLDSFV